MEEIIEEDLMNALDFYLNLWIDAFPKEEEEIISYIIVKQHWNVEEEIF